MLLLFLLLWGGMVSTSVLAQEKSITGKVTADDGSGLPGVSVVVKGTTRGTNTDGEGNFKINAPANARLLFSYVGFAPQEIAVGNQTTFSVKLLPDAASLEEVVITTFGTAKKASFTGSAAKIDAKDLGPRPSLT